MRHRVLNVLLLFLPGIALAGQLNDDVNAFNGYTLETPTSRYPSFRLIQRYSTEFVPDVTVYDLPGEQLTLAGVPFTKIRYRFADGLLESIQLTYEGSENREKLLQWIEKNYGKLSPQERRIFAQVLWRGEKMLIMLNYNRAYNEGTLWFVSPSLHQEINRTTGSIPD
jgi:hypothetical protein